MNCIFKCEFSSIFQTPKGQACKLQHIYLTTDQWPAPTDSFLCITSGKRIPAADAVGATAGRGFKLGRQASESHRTCCWCRWLAGDPTFSHPLSLLQFASTYSHDQPHTHTIALAVGGRQPHSTITLDLKKADCYILPTKFKLFIEQWQKQMILLCKWRI